MTTNFADALQNQIHINDQFTETENGATAYKSSGKTLVDMNFKLSSYRNRDVAEIVSDFAKLHGEDFALAGKFLFFIGDVRGGAGERRTFRVCLKWLANNYPDEARVLLKLVPEYNRWDSLVELLDTPIANNVVNLLHNQITQDLEEMKQGRPISLCAKWMPSINTSSMDSRYKARLLAGVWRWTEKQYRKTLASLRAYSNVTEVPMSGNQWGSIDYTKVPSMANLKYKSAFLRHDVERRQAYLESVKNGEVKINAATAAPHDIVHSYSRLDSDDIDDTLEELWKALPDYVGGDDTSIAVVDDSGSMFSPIGGRGSCDAVEVARALGLYFASRLNGGFKDKYITFSATPRFLDFSEAATLREKLNVAELHSECANTNIEAVFDLILETAASNHMTQDQLPKRIIIFSDMEFDECAMTNDDVRNNRRWGNLPGVKKSLFDTLAGRYQAHGYQLPHLVFWNICGRTDSIPLKENELGVTLMSGFSTSLVKMAMTGRLDPLEAILDVLNSPRYQPVVDNLQVLAT